LLAEDPDSRVACETLVTTGLVIVAGEITTEAWVDIPAVVRRTVTEIGYTDAKFGLDGETCGVVTAIQEQSADIARGVDDAVEHREKGSADDLDQLGAGDQGMMVGFACRETDELMPLPIALAHRLAKRLADVRKAGVIPYLRPDGKSQVSIEYRDGRPVRVASVLISAQHREEVDVETLLKPDVEAEVIEPILREFPELDHSDVVRHVNPTGRFEIGGPKADTGLTGRKIIVDTYGGYARHGGGAFSGKDPSKVDRSAAYAVRWVARNIVDAGLARRCEVQVAYSIGLPDPLAIMVYTYGTGVIPDDQLLEIIKDTWSFKPAAMIQYLDMQRPIFKKTAVYGHFGRTDPDFTWEYLNKVEVLRDKAGLKGSKHQQRKP
ncbi:MAG: methionine adenosyltransferase, partial [Syntrophobacterales bacterium]|nr:methionine adenosyltransferase [Syntrophobacterales bacterium]